MHRMTRMWRIAGGKLSEAGRGGQARCQVHCREREAAIGRGRGGRNEEKGEKRERLKKVEEAQEAPQQSTDAAPR
jgi:hypothetical protein